MKCYYHPEVDAVATCMNCGKAICATCSVDVAGRIVCQQCLSSGNVPRFQQLSAQPAQPSKQYNILAIVSLALGVIGLCGTWPFSIAAWITGHIARKQITENPDQEGMQLATAGMWLGIIITVLYSIILICYLGAIMVFAITSSH